MNIGKKIKELRKINNMTQEKLADSLGISSQSVSKWKCGVTLPDLSMIPGLTKLFHVTSDDLLGLNDPKLTDERRIYFDTAQERWNEDDIETYAANAEEAVREFPDDMKYLAWHASCIQMLVITEKDEEKRNAMYERAVRICDRILENTSEAVLRNSALSTAVYSLVDMGRRDEAQYYAEQYPDSPSISKEALFSITLTGTERAIYDQKQLLEKLEALLSSLSSGDPMDERIPELCDTAEKIVCTCFSDGNYLYQYDYLFMMEITRACHFAYRGMEEKSILALKHAREYAQAFDKIFIENPGTYRYTSPLFSLVELTEKDCHLFAGQSRVDSFRWWLDAVWFDSMRNQSEFHKLEESIKKQMGL